MPGGPLAPHAAAPATVDSRARTVARTSWTRTMPTPWSIAHTAVATTPRAGRRGAGVPPSAVSRPRNDLRLVPDHAPAIPWPRGVRGAGAGTVVVGGLAETDARVDPDLAHASGPRPLGPLDEEAATSADHVVVARVAAASSAGSPCMCMATQPTPRRRGHRGQRRGHVVDQRGPGLDGGLGHRRPCGCRSTPGRAAPAPRPQARPAQLLGLATAPPPGGSISPPTSTTSAPSATSPALWRPRRRGRATARRRRRNPA